MPIAAVAREPGSIKAEHGADLSGAQPRHQPLKAGPCHHPAGGAAEIVIDHLNVAEAPLPPEIDEVVLPLALEIGLDLFLGGLPNIDHRLALQHRRRQKPALVIVTLPAATPTASNRRLASRASTVLRSDRLFPLALPNRTGC
jgi:hypothetical protein